MKLHFDLELFKDFINQIYSQAKTTGETFPIDILEKDYYVTLLLKELAERSHQGYAYFKGGTALYKSLKRIQRFSEDIDLTVDMSNINPTQAKKRLEQSAKYTSLNYDIENLNNNNQKGSITKVYQYDTQFMVVGPLLLQRPEVIKIESTSFTVSEPVESYTIEPLVYTLATDNQKHILENQFDIKPFKVLTISLERIFVDKIFASEFYYERNDYYDVSKHMYDMVTLYQLESITGLLKNPERLKYLISLKRLEESRRIGSTLSLKSFKDFKVIFEGENNQLLKYNFKDMQEKYVFNNVYKKDIDEVFKTLRKLFVVLCDLE